MKILHINNYHYPRGGSDRYFLDVARSLEVRGHLVATLSPYSIKDTSRNLRVGDTLEPLCTSKKPSLKSLMRFFYNNDAKRSVTKVLDEFKPDIVHLHIYYGQLTSSIISPIRRSKVPIVQTLHEYKIVCPAQTLRRGNSLCTSCQNGRYWNCIIYRCNRGNFLRSATSTVETLVSNALGSISDIDLFLSVSQDQKLKLLEMGLGQNKVVVLYNFTDPANMPSQSIGDYFLYAGRLVKGKGLITLVNAYQIYKERKLREALPLHIAGDGDYESELRYMVDRLGLNSNIKWLGHCSGNDLVEAYRNSRALINPSELNETFGLNNLEAMAQGRPVICSNVGAFTEIVRDEIDGFIFDKGDQQALADKMLAMSSKLALDLGSNAYERVVKNFSSNLHIEKLEGIYKKVIQSKLDARTYNQF